MDLSNSVEQKSNDIAKQGIAVQNVICLQSRLRDVSTKKLTNDERNWVHLSLQLQHY